MTRRLGGTRNGTYKKYGLNVQLVSIPSSGTDIQALLGGTPEIQIAFEQNQIAGAGPARLHRRRRRDES